LINKDKCNVITYKFVSYHHLSFIASHLSSKEDKDGNWLI